MIKKERHEKQRQLVLETSARVLELTETFLGVSKLLHDQDVLVLSSQALQENSVALLLASASLVSPNFRIVPSSCRLQRRGFHDPQPDPRPYRLRLHHRTPFPKLSMSCETRKRRRETWEPPEEEVVELGW
ncbi:unnamed protein product [Arabis nemorensis]|uniref:Uncharacterized protein n=1 Tax=Arabis nemorensis TaxID=586526 RepID=A0A565CDX4_9BRAS|nr:unnamed protein product [Arabis nemorensis]